MAEFLQETIDEHRKSFDPSHLRDLLDTYLYEIQKANEEGNGHNLFEGKDHGEFNGQGRTQRPSAATKMAHSVLKRLSFVFQIAKCNKSWETSSLPVWRRSKVPCSGPSSSCSIIPSWWGQCKRNWTRWSVARGFLSSRTSPIFPWLNPRSWRCYDAQASCPWEPHTHPLGKLQAAIGVRAWSLEDWVKLAPAKKWKSPYA